ncbi:Oidioi.mRNA.OKI2018_I69.chr1.g2182.t1.cds [Oikopleura dioica]|uniref:Oidioi.mRNA.OKI2018_I69.chr1.g2182.t1.cds n=1 Tax=Oikopleura dioica TaxID=34765 RepID=A0ABN7SQC1_OIKDI|nr:Oidioi.mRNA.OKI2018_I69.chr1.g2182.t1.cds [Oikopleura dioica]
MQFNQDQAQALWSHQIAGLQQQMMAAQAQAQPQAPSFAQQAFGSAQALPFINPLIAQVQIQQQLQLQQLQRLLEAQKLFNSPRSHHHSRSGHGTPNNLPKNQRKQFKARQQNTSNNHNNATSGNNGASNAPEEEKAQPFKRIVAINLPAKYQNVEALTSVFHPYGDVNIVRVLKPGKNIPADIKQWIRLIPDLGRTACAVIDFETARAAKFAVHVFRQRENEMGFRCALLKPGVDEKLYSERETVHTTKLDLNLSSSLDTSDSGVTSEDAHSGDSVRSSSASERSASSEPEILSDSDGEHNLKTLNFSKFVSAPAKTISPAREALPISPVVKKVVSAVEPKISSEPKVYDREFLSKFSKINTRPAGLPDLDYITLAEKLESEAIRQPRGPRAGTKGFKLRIQLNTGTLASNNT